MSIAVIEQLPDITIHTLQNDGVVKCKREQLRDMCHMTVTAGTTGNQSEKNGWKHANTIFEISNDCCVNLDVIVKYWEPKKKAYRHINMNDVSGVRLEFFCEVELQEFIEAMEFAIKTYKDKLKQDDEEYRREYRKNTPLKKRIGYRIWKIKYRIKNRISNIKNRKNDELF